METRTFHPLADLFPLLEGNEYEALRDDIAAQGQLEPIWLHADGRILDGRNRYRACCDIGVVPHYRTFEGDDDEAFDLVYALNFHRRHLTSSQRAVLGLAVEEYEARRAKERQAQNALNNQPQKVETIPLSDTGKARDKAAEAVGTNARYISDAKRIRAEAPDLLPKVQAGTLTIPDAKKLVQLDAPTRSRAVGRIERGEAKSVRDAVRVARREEYEARVEESGPVPLPDGPFRVLYADPPWSYGNNGLDEYGHAERHYRTMTTDDLCELGVPAIAADDAVLFLWATSPLLEDALRVLRAWGFAYKSSFVWDKVRHNFGYYNSVRHEFLLIGTRGSCLPDEKKLFDSVVTLERTERHSEKPEEFRSIINTLYPVGPHVELFARRPAEGWAVWGNEA